MLKKCKSDRDCVDTNLLTCSEGRCKIKVKKWCYPGNDMMPCFNVCESKATCTKMSIKKP